ncbi:MAG: L-threonylcarbamoyladenylate synthase [Candidatus Babeliales bacterium]|nr:L-threonylcarbamoyladenylate synthase [Candidatus Babeliales bacterium]
MKTKILHWNNPESINILKVSLESKKVALTTTDTILGLLATTDKEGSQALDSLKNRCLKPYIVLLDSVDKAFLYAQITNEKIIQFIKLCWPGPVTIIFKSNKSGNFYLKTSSDTIGIRIPRHSELLKLLSHFDGLYSTSANISGQAVPKSISEVNSEIIDAVGCIVVEDDVNIETVPSTILDCTADKIRVIREGAYPIDKLEKLYGEAFIKGE